MRDPREQFALADRHLIERTNALRTSGSASSGFSKPVTTRALRRIFCAFYLRRAKLCWLTETCWNLRWPNGARCTPNNSYKTLRLVHPTSKSMLRHRTPPTRAQLTRVL